MNGIKATAKLNQRELEEVIPPSASWHRDYDDTAFIYIGGLPLELTEGDVITIFSQYGEPVFINLVRDKETGKSKGFCFLKYEDQRSCDLAVDNLGGATVLGRLLRVDHTRYKKRDDEEIVDNTMGPVDERAIKDSSGQVSDTESEDAPPPRPLLKEEIELQELLRNEDDDDPMKAYMIQQKKEEVEVALKALVKRESKAKSRDGKHRRHKSHRSGRQDSEGPDRCEKRSRRQRSRTPAEDTDIDVVRQGKERHRSRTPIKAEDSDSEYERQRRRKEKRRSRTPIMRDTKPSKPRGRDRSATPVYDSDAMKSKARRRDRSISRSRSSPIRSSDQGSAATKHRRDRSDSRDGMRDRRRDRSDSYERPRDRSRDRRRR
jgi:RNA-binding motif X-linked protein 2